MNSDSGVAVIRKEPIKKVNVHISHLGLGEETRHLLRRTIARVLLIWTGQSCSQRQFDASAINNAHVTTEITFIAVPQDVLDQ